MLPSYSKTAPENVAFKGKSFTENTSTWSKISKFVGTNFQKILSLSNETVADISVQKESITAI